MFGASTTFFEPIRIGCRIDAQHRADFPNLYDLASRRGIGIHSALDFCKALCVTVNHAGDCDHASDKDCDDRNQQTTQTQNRVD
jgi:hypothetical protein